MQKIILEITNLTKTYALQRTPALSDFSLSIPENERIGIVGANGSGKTTLFRLLMNLIKAEKGEIKINGEKNLEIAKKFLGFVPEHQEGLENFTARELLALAGKMSGMKKDKIENRIGSLLKFSELENEQNSLISGFSKGMIQRLQLSLALVHQPKILLFDEPMSGLDPAGQKRLKSLLTRLENHTILYASHNLNEIEEFCDRVIILKRGKILEDLKITQQEETLFTFTSSAPIEHILNQFNSISITEALKGGRTYHYSVKCSLQLMQQILNKISENKITLSNLKSRSILEEIYNKKVRENA